MSDRVERNKSIYSYVLTPIGTLLRNASMALMAAAFTTIFTPALNAAELVVIASSNSDFKAGQVVDSSSDIKLANDATLTLISESGKVFALKGPRSGVVEVKGSADKNGGLISSIKNILAGEKTEVTTLGVMRSIGAPERPSDPWAIIAGKTGTAQVAKERGAGYRTNYTKATFAGFGPVEDPSFVMVVMLDHPRAVPWAADTAAPIFGEISDFLLQYLQTPPTRMVDTVEEEIN